MKLLISYGLVLRENPYPIRSFGYLKYKGGRETSQV